MNDILSFILLLEQHKRKQIERTIDALTVDEVQTDEDIFQTIFASGLIFLGSLISFLILLWIVNMCFQLFTFAFEQQENIDDLFYSKVEQPPTYNSVICSDKTDLPSFYTAVNNVTSTIIPAIDCSKDMTAAPYSPLSNTTADAAM
jgi:hypothetical protein